MEVLILFRRSFFEKGEVMSLKKSLRRKNLIVVPLKKNCDIKFAKFGNLETRSLTTEETRRLNVLQNMGTVQKALIYHRGPLTYIEAGGVVGQESWMIIIHHDETDTPTIYFAPNLGPFNEMDWGQLEVDDLNDEE